MATGQTAGCIKTPLGMEVGLSPDGDPALSPKRGGGPQFSAHGCMDQDLFRMEVGLGLRDIVLDGDPAPPLKGCSPPIFGNVCCGQTTGWTKMALGMDVGLGPGDFVMDGDPATARKDGTPTPPNFWPICVLWPNGWMDEDATWYTSIPRPRPHCARRGRSSP